MGCHNSLFEVHGSLVSTESRISSQIANLSGGFGFSLSLSLVFSSSEAWQPMYGFESGQINTKQKRYEHIIAYTQAAMSATQSQWFELRALALLRFSHTSIPTRLLSSPKSPPMSTFHSILRYML